MRSLFLSICLALATSSAAQVINVLGDSYVRNHRRPYEETWHYLAAQRLGWTYRNYGRNGSAVTFDRTKDGFGPKMIDRAREMNDTADVVMVIAGHNDAALIEEGRGTLDDYRRELSTLLDALREKYPTARLCCVTPWHVARKYFGSVVDVLRQECKSRDIPLLDLYDDPTIDVENEEFRKQYFQPSKGNTDRAHLNAEGHRLLVGKGAQFLANVSGRRDVLDRSVWRRDSVGFIGETTPANELKDYYKVFGRGYNFVLMGDAGTTNAREYYINGDTALVEAHQVSPIRFRPDGTMEQTWVNNLGQKVIELWRRSDPELVVKAYAENFRKLLLEPMLNTEWKKE